MGPALRWLGAVSGGNGCISGETPFELGLVDTIVSYTCRFQCRIRLRYSVTGSVGLVDICFLLELENAIHLLLDGDKKEGGNSGFIVDFK